MVAEGSSNSFSSSMVHDDEPVDPVPIDRREGYDRRQSPPTDLRRVHVATSAASPPSRMSLSSLVNAPVHSPPPVPLTFGRREPSPRRTSRQSPPAAQVYAEEDRRYYAELEQQRYAREREYEAERYKREREYEMGRARELERHNREHDRHDTAHQGYYREPPVYPEHERRQHTTYPSGSWEGVDHPHHSSRPSNSTSPIRHPSRHLYRSSSRSPPRAHVNGGTYHESTGGKGKGRSQEHYDDRAPAGYVGERGRYDDDPRPLDRTAVYDDDYDEEYDRGELVDAPFDPAAHAAQLARRAEEAELDRLSRERAEQRAAADAAVVPPPKKKAVRKPRVSKAQKAQEAEAKAKIIDDELMGLVEGDTGSHAPSAADEAIDELMDDAGTGPSRVQSPASSIAPSVGALPVLTNSGRAKILNLEDPSIAHRVSLEEDAWRQSSKTADVRKKDGSIRRKPGPRKGWKDLAKQQGIDLTSRRGSAGPSQLRQHVASSERGDAASNPGGSVRGWEEGSHRVGTDYGSDADSSIVALLDDEKSGHDSVKHTGKRRKLDNGSVEGQHTYQHDDEDAASQAVPARSSEQPEDEHDPEHAQTQHAMDPSLKRLAKAGRVKEPGVGKGKWTRPTKQERDLKQSEMRMSLHAAAVRQTGGDDSAYQVSGHDMHIDLPHPRMLSGPPEPHSSPLNGFASEYPTPPLPGHLPNASDGWNQLPYPQGHPSHAAPGRAEGVISQRLAIRRANEVEAIQRQIWDQIVKRDIPKMHRIVSVGNMNRVSNAKRIVVITQRYSERASARTMKANKDATAKAKRVVKEMMTFWKKNEKDEVAAKRRADKLALEKAKAEEEARESKRAARKLNFLITQTELYSHFIGKKIKTHEAEDSGDATGVSAPPAPESAGFGNAELGLDVNGEPLGEFDYDDDDEENLRRHAAKGAQAAIDAAKQKAADFDTRTASDRKKPDEDMAEDGPMDLDGDELNFQNPTMAPDQVTITQPKLLMAQLKEYQLKGLTWLGNLYEQGINGILADEMGLGKTVQSISLLAYLAEVHDIWGPFLVIAPASTLHNWQQELSRFVPKLKALPYWGGPKDRETLRKVWCKKNMTYNEKSPFHIIVTSYQLAVGDEQYFKSINWQYMILDEAQAIKSSSSMRWKTLLNLPCRNRLLLTGTPIQNSMQELWALLHFIMPQLFDNHDEFSEWFSKDIENAAGGNSTNLNIHQLRRLHMILKPFMLRRVKAHVQKELGDKIEIDLLVDLSQRQRRIYKALRQRVSISDLIAQANNMGDAMGAKSLMNLVMQFRKVCNHPDLFERADVVAPFAFAKFNSSGNLLRQPDLLYCPGEPTNPIQVNVPKILWTDGGILSRPAENGRAGSDTKNLQSLMSIWSTDWIADSLKANNSGFDFLALLDKSPGEVHRDVKVHPVIRLLSESLKQDRVLDETIITSGKHRSTKLSVSSKVPVINDLPNGLPSPHAIASTAWIESYHSRPDARFAIEAAVAPLIKGVCSDRSFENDQERSTSDAIVERALYGLSASERDQPQAVARLQAVLPGARPGGLIASSPKDQLPLTSMRVPDIKRLVVDSAKLARLDSLLKELKAGGHRVLVYFQMTRMMDLVEEYLVYRQYKYLRLDGGSAIGERRDMVTSWQTNPEIFVFCLSTRAGGLGINLTAADTVVFYDHDWNPSNDAQAMDRAHRVGQTKQVTVYRLIARGTIEERIVKLARAKKDVQDIVVGSKSLTDVAKPNELVSLFLDDEDLADSVAKQKQAAEHGYVAPTNGRTAGFGDGLGRIDDDEDDFFGLSKKTNNADDEDFQDDKPGTGANTPQPGTKKPRKKAAAVTGDGEKPVKKKAPPKPRKSKAAVGPDGMPL